MTPIEWTAQQAVRPGPTYAASARRPAKPGYTPTALDVIDLLEAENIAISVAGLCERMGLSRTTVRHAVRQLDKHLRIASEPGPMGGNQHPTILWRATKWTRNAS